MKKTIERIAKEHLRLSVIVRSVHLFSACAVCAPVVHKYLGHTPN